MLRGNRAVAFYGKTPAESMLFHERCKHTGRYCYSPTAGLTTSGSATVAERRALGYGFLGVFTLYSLISVEK